MRVASLAEVKAKLSTYLKEAKESGPVVITRDGRAVSHEEFWKNVQQRSADSPKTEGRHQ